MSPVQFTAVEAATSETPLRATFKVRLNGKIISIGTVGQAYKFITNLSSIEWMEFKSLHGDTIALGRRRVIRGGLAGVEQFLFVDSFRCQHAFRITPATLAVTFTARLGIISPMGSPR